MSDSRFDDELPPRRRRQLATGFWVVGIVICLFVGAAIVTGTPIRTAGQYLPPGLIAIAFSLFLQWAADQEADQDAA